MARRRESRVGQSNRRCKMFYCSKGQQGARRLAVWPFLSEFEAVGTRKEQQNSQNRLRIKVQDKSLTITGEGVKDTPV